MKICFVISYIGIGGVGTVFISVLEALLKYTGAEITIYFHDMPTEKIYLDWLKLHPTVIVKTYYRYARWFENLKAKCKFLPLAVLRKICFSMYKKYCNRKISRQITKEKFDAVIDFVSGESYKQTKFIKGTKKITWVHCSTEFVRTHNLIKKIAAYDNIVCLSDAGKAEFASAWPQYADKLVRIYNPINYSEINKQSKKLPTYDGKYFLCVGRLDHDKDILTIIRAFNDFYVCENHPDIKMVFVGSGNIENEMRDLALQTEAKNNIVFLGRMIKPYGIMRGAVAHILSSFNEGFGLVLVESMAVGTVNISSDCPNGPHEILMNGRAGLLFTPGSVKELSKIMSDVYHDRLVMSGIAQTATKSLSRFNPKKIAGEIIKIIKEVL